MAACRNCYFLKNVLKCNNSIFKPLFRLKSRSYITSVCSKNLSTPQTNRKRHNLVVLPTRKNSTETGGNFGNLFKSVTESDVVSSVKDGLIAIHDTTGLPWAGTILLTTVTLRTLVTFPLGIYQAYVLARLELVKLEFAGVVEELKKETAVAIKQFGWTEKQARAVYNISVKKQWRLIIERDNCHPLKSVLVVFIQVPVWILLSLSLRCMSYGYGTDPFKSGRVLEQLIDEGWGWFPNLLMPDLTGLLPLSVCIFNLIIIELQASTRANHTRPQRIMTNVFRGLALVSFPIAVSVPAGTIAKLNDIETVEGRLGLLPSTSWSCYTISSHPGLIVIRNPFTSLGQRYWVARCLQDYTAKPSRRNVDIEDTLRDTHNLWDHCQRTNEALFDKLRWATIGYHHNWDTKIYTEANKSDFPEDLTQLCRHLAQVLRYPSFTPQAAIVNFYHHGCSLSGHVDKSEVDLDAPLFSLSFCQSAIFLIGGKTLNDTPTPLLLQSGDVLVMSREARLCYHAVPRIVSASQEPWQQLSIDTFCDDLDPRLAGLVADDQFWDPFPSGKNNLKATEMLARGFSISQMDMLFAISEREITRGNLSVDNSLKMNKR